MNNCGECRMCCKVMNVIDGPVNKSDGEWCTFCSIKTGCTIYETRPRTCREFKCEWLASQEDPDPSSRLPMDLRPDKCKVVLAGTTDPLTAMAYVDPGRRDAWQADNVMYVIHALLKQGMRVTVSDGDSLEKIILYMDKNGVVHKTRRPFTPPDENGIQWHIPGPRQ